MSASTRHNEERITDASGVADGVHDAFCRIMNALGDYPMTRDDILDAVREGVHDAFAEWLARVVP
jgi:hypothetical protein